MVSSEDSRLGSLQGGQGQQPLAPHYGNAWTTGVRVKTEAG